jgi:GTP-binding protein HflX
MPQKKERTQLQVTAERAVLAAVRLPDSEFDREDPFGELRALAEQAGAVVVGEMSQNLPRPVAGTYMGEGKVRELKALCDQLDASTIIFDHDLSPRQLSRIEQITGRKVLDRSELILDIFAGRATTREAQLQVELAQLEYTYPRLRAMWDHLERIVGRGAIGGVGTRGPGEQQLEIDRRLVKSRKEELRRQLEAIRARKRREVQERRREHFTVGLVGYTNAGKSTLFNSLTAGGAYADDRLFSTLITRTREWDLGGGLSVMLSDTVGFVRNIPHHLVASFKATLEEVTHADLLLIVLDVSDPAAELQFATVERTLDEVFADLRREESRLMSDWSEPRRLLLLNKIDRLASNAQALVWKTRHPEAIPICAKPGADGRPRQGYAELVQAVRRIVEGDRVPLTLSVPLCEGRTLARIESLGQVESREYDGDRVRLRARIGRRVLERLRAGGSRLEIADEPAVTNGAWRS